MSQQEGMRCAAAQMAEEAATTARFVYENTLFCWADINGAETTALGAAMLAAVGAGELASLSAATSMWSLDESFVPSLAADAREGALAGWHAAVDKALLGT